MKEYTLSIITVCFNAEKYIEKTLDSVLNQTYTGYEYIIIDGFSTDSTKDIINEYLNRFKEKSIKVTYISESDKGIYDAMNKGAMLSSGMWINYLNAGDSFYNSKTLESIFNKSFYEDIDVIYGNTNRVFKNKNEIQKALMPNTITRHIPFCHQSSFIKSNLQKKYMFDVNYRIAADYDLFLRLYLKNKKFLYLDLVVSSFLMGGVSNNNYILTYKENMNIREKYALINRNSIFSKAKLLYFIAKVKTSEIIKNYINK